MTVWGYYISAMRHYADFDGRASRSELFAYLAGMAVILFAAALVGPALLNVTPVILVLAILGHLVPTLAVAVRRVHDADTPGAALLVGLIPYIGWFVLFLFAIAPPSPLTNRFGQNPRQQPQPQSFTAFQFGKWWGRTIEGLRNRSANTHAVPPLPEPPASLAIELGLTSSPAETPTVDPVERKRRLLKLRDSGMLSEAEYIRLTRELS